MNTLARLLRLALFAPALVGGSPGFAAEPSYFTFTPNFKDPDPGRRIWEKRGQLYVETLPSGRTNTFQRYKPGHVGGQPGIIVQKQGEPDFYVFISDSEARKHELWWWRAQGDWHYMGRMENIRAPQRID